MLTRNLYRLTPIAAAIALLVGCGSGSNSSSSTSTQNLQSNIDTIVVIYAENRSFDNLYGLFPGADGIANALKDPALYTQLDRDGTVLPYLPVVWSSTDKSTGLGTPITNPPPAPGSGQPALTGDYTWIGGPGSGPGKENKPFLISADKVGMDPLAAIAPDVVHRFYNNQMQINGGANNKFVAWTDIGGLTMGYYDASSTKMWKLAQQYVLADKFFQGAFGGSFLNHQYLACACAPEWNQNVAGVTFPIGQVSILSPDAFQVGYFNLERAPQSRQSALTGGPVYVNDSKMTPKSPEGKYYAINTAQPSFQPSGTAPTTGSAVGSTDWYMASPTGNGSSSAQPLPPLTQKTIGDRLTEAGVKWKWYSGAWNEALYARSGIYALPSEFQPHHQPYNYYSRFTPATEAGRVQRAEHLRDESELIADAKAGTLPSVVFYKPAGVNNQHAGYASIKQGDEQMASIIEKLMAGPQWGKMAIIVTYDENGGFFDHAKVPTGDYWGPGTRIPAIIISPHAKKGYVDSTTYDIGSIHQFISRRFNLALLDGVRKQFGDLTNAFNF